MNGRYHEKTRKDINCSPDPGGSYSKKSGFLINISQQTEESNNQCNNFINKFHDKTCGREERGLGTI